MEILLNKAMDICAKIISINRNDFSGLSGETAVRGLIRSCEPSEAKEISRTLIQYYQGKYFSYENFDFSRIEYQSFYKFVLSVQKALREKGALSRKINADISTKKYEKFKEYILEWNFDLPVPTKVTKAKILQASNLQALTDIKVDQIFSGWVFNRPFENPNDEFSNGSITSNSACMGHGFIALYNNGVTNFVYLDHINYAVSIFSGTHERIKTNPSCLKMSLYNKKEENAGYWEILIYLDTCKLHLCTGQLLDFHEPYRYFYAYRSLGENINGEAVISYFDKLLNNNLKHTIPRITF